MSILIIYGSNSSGAHEVAEMIGDVFLERGGSVDIVRADKAVPSEFSRYTLIVFGSCTWELVTGTERLDGQLQEHFLKLESDLRGKKFTSLKFAVYGLGDESYTNFCNAAVKLEELVKRIGGTLACETLRINKFFFNLEKNRSIVHAWATMLLTLAKQGARAA